ncbi:hypothetical protein PIB30_104072, partial [Stylosanthes scabra]|nr:hypothetical protein [Stylosanthes scabra]
LGHFQPLLNIALPDRYCMLEETKELLPFLVFGATYPHFRFHGLMETAKDNSVWNMIQTVDVAFNNFSGELPVKWFRGWPSVRTSLDVTLPTTLNLLQTAESSVARRAFQAVDSGRR